MHDQKTELHIAKRIIPGILIKKGGDGIDHQPTKVLFFSLLNPTCFVLVGRRLSLIKLFLLEKRGGKGIGVVLELLLNVKALSRHRAGFSPTFV